MRMYYLLAIPYEIDLSVIPFKIFFSSNGKIFFDRNTEPVDITLSTLFRYDEL